MDQQLLFALFLFRFCHGSLPLGTGGQVFGDSALGDFSLAESTATLGLWSARHDPSHTSQCLELIDRAGFN